MHRCHKQATNQCVSFHIELKTWQNYVFQQFIVLHFPMLQINGIVAKRVDLFG